MIDGDPTKAHGIGTADQAADVFKVEQIKFPRLEQLLNLDEIVSS